MIGAGHAAGQLHLPAFRRLPQLEIKSVFDIDRAKAEALASQLPGARVAAGADDIISDCGIDAVAILTPPGSHAVLLKRALQAGKHVLVEKPLSCDGRELDELVALAQASKSVIAVGHNLRCHRLVRRARAMIESGVLGAISGIRTVWSSPTRVRAGWNHEAGLEGSVLLDIAVHHVDLLAYLGSSRVSKVHATVVGGNRNSESASISGRLENGALFTSMVARRGPFEHNIHVSCTKGAIEFSCQKANAWRVIPELNLGMAAQASEMRQYLAELPALVTAARTGGDWLESYPVQWREFISAVREGTRVPCTVAEAAEAARVCIELSESAG